MPYQPRQAFASNFYRWELCRGYYGSAGEKHSRRRVPNTLNPLEVEVQPLFEQQQLSEHRWATDRCHQDE